ncbi:MlaD family protein [Mycobacteroides franklinii]|uniref:MlaD family protein n=1 Tax=Mycobacteroides franklinii TaxID=948102 RepID=UPI0013E8EE46|nr:mammalian cell entry protein [Mycobacteroides franklinii]
MRTAKNVLSFGAFAAIIVVAAVYIGSFGLHAGPPERRINLSMAVPDVKGLVVGSSVLLRGVPIGKVTGVSASLSDANIRFYVDADQRVPVDSDVRLDNLSALGETYIGFLPRTDQGPMLTDGQHIAAESVIVPPSISQLATTVVRVLNQMDPGQLKRILNEADAGLPNPGQVLPNLSRASLLSRNMVAGMHGKGREVLDNFQVLLQNAGWVGPKLAATDQPLRDAGPNISHIFMGMMNTIAWDNPKNIKLFGNFLVRIQNFLDTRGPDIKVITQALLPQFQGIGGALMNFDTAQILSNALSGIPEEGAITLHVRIPDR